jgi:hypothetical protein
MFVTLQARAQPPLRRLQGVADTGWQRRTS